MASIDVAELVGDIKNAASGVIGKDVAQLRGFAEAQVEAIAQQASIVAAGIADGSISGETKDYFLDSLEEMARSFVNTLSGMVSVVIEQAWNAVVGAVWAAINKVTGLALTVP